MLRDFLNRLMPTRRAPAAGMHPEEAADRLIAEGNRAETEGKLREACKLYGKAVAAAPHYGKAHLNLGIALEALGEAEPAVAAFEAACAIDPADPYASYNLGRLFYTRGALARAEQLLRSAVERKPDFPEAQVVLSSVHDSQGNLAAAAAALEDALRQRPDYAGALRNYGMVLAKLGRPAEAEAALRRAVAADTTDADAYYRLGNVLVHQDKLDDAMGFYRRAIELRPDFAEAWCRLGNVLTDRGQNDDAMRCLTRALAIRPDFIDALVGLGNVHSVEYRLETAEGYYREAIALDPGIPLVYMNLGHVLKELGRLEDALDCYRKALELRPDFAQARWSATMCLIPVLREANDDLARSRARFAADLESLDRWFDATRAAEGHDAVGVQQPFWLAYQEQDNRELLERYGRLCARLMARWQDEQGLRPAQQPGKGRVRVGIVSRHFRDHSVWNALVKGWFQWLDRERFVLAAFCLGPEQDTETHYARSRAERFEQGRASARQWVEAILEAQPDVLIYPEIGMDPMTVKLASLRLAPVQVASWGHPETTGLPTIDYYLSAEDLEPVGAQASYSERLIALPHLGCFVQSARVESAAIDLDAWGIEARTPLLLCPGTPFKYAPEHDSIFPEIARRLGRCRFVFFAHWARGLSEKLRQRLATAFSREGLDFDQFAVFIPWQQKPAFYELLRRADVFLDTIGFSGFNTALQAVECGLPIVTREGRFLRGRLASGILRRMGLPELVAQSEEAYVELAVRLARDAEYREHIRGRMVASRHVLFEDMAPIRALEDFLLTTSRRN